MFESFMQIILLVVGVVIILALAGVAAFLHWQLHLRKKRDATLLAEQEAKIAKSREEACNSLRIIAKSLLADQVELGEAGIRVSNLMDYLSLDESQRAPYRVFDEINAKLKHIPILKQWKQISPQERRKHLKVISSVEGEYQDFAKDAAKSLATFEVSKATFYAV